MTIGGKIMQINNKMNTDTIHLEQEDADVLMEENAVKWTTEDDFFEDELVVSATTSISASNPWLFYESGIICARDSEGELMRNSSGEKVINLREEAHSQRIELRHDVRRSGRSSEPH